MFLMEVPPGGNRKVEEKSFKFYEIDKISQIFKTKFYFSEEFEVHSKTEEYGELPSTLWKLIFFFFHISW